MSFNIEIFLYQFCSHHASRIADNTQPKTMLPLHQLLSVYSISRSLDVLRDHYGNHFQILETQEGLTRGQVPLADYLQSMGSLPDRRLELSSLDSFSSFMFSFDLIHPGRRLGVHRNGSVLYHLPPPDRYLDTIGISVRRTSSQRNGYGHTLAPCDQLSLVSGNGNHPHNGHVERNHDLALEPDQASYLETLLTTIVTALATADKKFFRREKSNPLSCYADLCRLRR